MKKIVVVMGANNVGLAIVRRMGPQYTWVLADCSTEKLESAAYEFAAAGFSLSTAVVDLTSQDSVESLARMAAGLGEIQVIIHTAILLLSMSNPEQILRVNLVGTAFIIQAFERHLSAGTVGMVIAEMAEPTGVDQGAVMKLATLEAHELVSFIGTLTIKDAVAAYSLSKYGNLAQVQVATKSWAEKGARIITISPGATATPLGKEEQYPVKHIGTAEEIAAVVDYLRSPQSSHVTGTDVLIDKGVYVYSKLSNQALVPNRISL